jgi:hypothetical protein
VLLDKPVCDISLLTKRAFRVKLNNTAHTAWAAPSVKQDTVAVVALDHSATVTQCAIDARGG